MGSSVSQDAIQASQVPLSVLAASGLTGELWPKQAVLEDNAEFDYIIAGGGTAGCVLARRLAEDKNNTVLMIEAGGDPPLSVMLAALFVLLPGSIADYNYTSTLDEHAAKGQYNHTMFTAGKMLGGSASLNHFINGRGTPSDYNCWDKICKNKVWTFKNVLPYFKKSERVVDDEHFKADRKFRGKDGPMGLSRQEEDIKEVADLLKSLDEVGNPTVLDLDTKKNVGYMLPLYTIADKKRQTPAYSYLYHIKDYPNLYVSKNTRATKVVIKNDIAEAVEAVYKDKTYTFKARKEIIISAGVYNTPQILMLSGIGPKEHLKSLNIDVLQDLPVGDNFQDQVAVSLVYKLKKYLLPVPDIADIPPDPTKIPFQVIFGAVSLNKSDKCPDYQSFGLKYPHDTPLLKSACSQVFGLRHDICDRWQKQVKSRDSLYIFLAHLHPKSRGTIRLNSTNPFATPEITSGHLQDERDLYDVVKFIRDFNTVTKTKYFQEIGAGLVGLDLPECADKEMDSDNFWKCYVSNHASSAYHSCCTCPMGKVVDCELRVKGVKKLRVVDASIMPNIPRGPPNAAVVMVAEKAADMIKFANSH